MGNCCKTKKTPTPQVQYNTAYLFLGVPVKPIDDVKSFILRCKKRSSNKYQNHAKTKQYAEISEKEILLLDFEETNRKDVYKFSFPRFDI